LFMIQ